MSDVRVKICGLTREADVDAAVAAGAAYVAFNFFPKSPRFVDVQRAAALAARVPPGLCRVALTVDADDATLDEIVREVSPDMLQLHGAETPERITALKARHGLPVMKAVGVAEAGDLAALEIFGRVADQILVDAKPPKGATRPGGNAVVFDWKLIAGRRWPVPWMLAGGLTPANVADAIRLTGARQVDVSSGVESAPGIKDASLITAFVAAAEGAMNVTFREAERGDVAAVVALLRDDVLGAGREAADAGLYETAFDAMQAETGNSLIVGEAEGRIVATYQLTFITGLSLRATRRAQIESVRVAGGLRGQGVGEKMIRDAEARARAAGCRLLQLTMNKSRKDTHRFYERLGFVPSHIGFKRDLS